VNFYVRFTLFIVFLYFIISQRFSFYTLRFFCDKLSAIPITWWSVCVFCLCTSYCSLFLVVRGGSSGGAAGLQPSLKNLRQKIPPNGQTRLKSGFSCEISQHNHVRYLRHHFCSTFPRNPTKPMFHSFPTTPLMRWRFQHTCRWIWRFLGCIRLSPEVKKPNNWLQETWWYIRLSQSVFVILTMNFWRINGGNMTLTVFHHLIFLDIEFYN